MRFQTLFTMALGLSSSVFALPGADVAVARRSENHAALEARQPPAQNPGLNIYVDNGRIRVIGLVTMVQGIYDLYPNQNPGTGVCRDTLALLRQYLTGLGGQTSQLTAASLWFPLRQGLVALNQIFPFGIDIVGDPNAAFQSRNTFVEAITNWFRTANPALQISVQLVDNAAAVGPPPHGFKARSLMARQDVCPATGTDLRDRLENETGVPDTADNSC